MRRVIFDIETDGLNPSLIWVLVARDIDTNEEFVFERPDQSPRALHEFTPTVGMWIGHNIISFDLPVLYRLISEFSIVANAVVDTLVCCRLFNYSLTGGHSLEAYGERLGFPKKKHEQWDVYSNEMLERCKQDVEITHQLFKRLEPYIYNPEWKQALRTEHDMAWICNELHDNGFKFDKEKAEEMHRSFLSEIQELDREITKEFPPKPRIIGEITPRRTKKGTLSKTNLRFAGNDRSYYSADCPFTRFEWEQFNPSSTVQIVERLNEAEWRPTEKTKGHLEAERAVRDGKEGAEERLEKFRKTGWKVSEENLSTLPPDAPKAAQSLVRRLLLDSRRSTLEEWLKAVSEPYKRIHGRFMHIGAWTHRMSHQNPNMANVPTHKLYGPEMRALWGVEPGWRLLGVDAEGIQLRIFAHYIEDETFIKALEEGKKEDGSDPHSLNERILAPNTKGKQETARDIAKRYIYAWLLGAGNRKQAEILGVSPQGAREREEHFIKSYPGLEELKKVRIPRDAERGYFIGLDGRKVKCDSEHLMLAGYLQNGEAVIMKMACLWWHKMLRVNWLLDTDWRFVNFVHDEWQTEIIDDQEIVELIAHYQVNSFQTVGEQLGLKCKLAGEAKGVDTPAYCWKDTH